MHGRSWSRLSCRDVVWQMEVQVLWGWELQVMQAPLEKTWPETQVRPAYWVQVPLAKVKLPRAETWKVNNEEELLPAVLPFSSYLTILTYIYEQDGLPGIGPATLAVNFACFIVSTIVAPQSADLSSTSFLLALDNHPQLRLRHLCGVCSSLLKYLISCRGQVWLGVLQGVCGSVRQVHPPGLRKIGQLKRKG